MLVGIVVAQHHRRSTAVEVELAKGRPRLAPALIRLVHRDAASEPVAPDLVAHRRRSMAAGHKDLKLLSTNPVAQVPHRGVLRVGIATDGVGVAVIVRPVPPARLAYIPILSRPLQHRFVKDVPIARVRLRPGNLRRDLHPRDGGKKCHHNEGDRSMPVPTWRGPMAGLCG